MEPKATIIFAEHVSENEQGNMVRNPFGTLNLVNVPSHYSFISHIVVSDLSRDDKSDIVLRLHDTNGGTIMETQALTIEKENRTDNVNINVHFENLLFAEVGYYSLEVLVNGQKVGENDFRVACDKSALNRHA